jgi:predicted anti-sigma-YlaC factor YlaD
VERAREHYRRALAISGGRRASVHLALAEAVSVGEQDLAGFRQLVAAALAVDPEADPGQRLVNVLAHRRARWLSSRVEDLFLDAVQEGEEP